MLKQIKSRGIYSLIVGAAFVFVFIGAITTANAGRTTVYSIPAVSQTPTPTPKDPSDPTPTPTPAPSPVPSPSPSPTMKP